MQAYRILDTAMSDGQQTVYFRHTRAAAHEQAKKYREDIRPDVRIHLIEIPTTALSIIDYLNGEQPLTDVLILKQWKLTPRGGLMELAADGSPAKDSDKGDA